MSLNLISAFMPLAAPITLFCTKIIIPTQSGIFGGEKRKIVNGCAEGVPHARIIVGKKNVNRYPDINCHLVLLLVGNKT
jgi:hypothetical protein